MPKYISSAYSKLCICTYVHIARMKVLRGGVIPTWPGAWQHVVLQTMCLDLVSGLTSEQCLHASVRFSRGMIRWQSVGPLKNIEGRSQMVIL